MRYGHEKLININH